MTSPCIPELQCDRFLPPKECCFKTIPPHQGWLLLLLAKRAFRIRWGKIKTKKKTTKTRKKEKSANFECFFSVQWKTKRGKERKQQKNPTERGRGDEGWRIILIPAVSVSLQSHNKRHRARQVEMPLLRVAAATQTTAGALEPGLQMEPVFINRLHFTLGTENKTKITRKNNKKKTQKILFGTGD